MKKIWKFISNFQLLEIKINKPDKFKSWSMDFGGLKKMCDGWKMEVDKADKRSGRVTIENLFLK